MVNSADAGGFPWIIPSCCIHSKSLACSRYREERTAGRRGGSGIWLANAERFPVVPGCIRSNRWRAGASPAHQKRIAFGAPLAHTTERLRRSNDDKGLPLYELFGPIPFFKLRGLIALHRGAQGVDEPVPLRPRWTAPRTRNKPSAYASLPAAAADTDRSRLPSLAAPIYRALLRFSGTSGDRFRFSAR